jgi:hypothetical protein
MEVELVCPRRWFEQLLQHGLRPEAEEQEFGAPLGVAVTRHRLQLLVREPFRSGRAGASAFGIRVRFRSGRPSRLPSEDPVGAHLILGRGPAEGRWAGWVRTPGDAEKSVLPVARILLPGPGMLRVEAGPEPERIEPPEAQLRWSRTRGALGEAVWRRLVGLRVGVVGCGRLGSVIALALAGNGVRSMVLVDPDRLETHNLGEGEGWTAANVGSPKVGALAGHIEGRYPWARVEAVAAPAEAWAALHALKGCDLLVCAADTAGARETAGLLSALYHLPLIEAGTGIFAVPSGERRMGLEARLVLPGEACRACMEGGPGEVEEAGLPWWADRMGSLRSLNMVAAGLVLLLLEGLVREEVGGPVELRWVWGEGFRWTGSGWRCGGPRCLRRVSGLGDEGLTACDGEEPGSGARNRSPRSAQSRS